jgi:hypothetical protein
LQRQGRELTKRSCGIFFKRMINRTVIFPRSSKKKSNLIIYPMYLIPQPTKTLKRIRPSARSFATVSMRTFIPAGIKAWRLTARIMSAARTYL